MTFGTILLSKAKRQYLLTYKVSRYRLLALHGGISKPASLWPGDRMELMSKSYIQVVELKLKNE